MLFPLVLFGLAFAAVLARHRHLARGASEVRRLELAARGARVSRHVEAVLAGLIAVHLAGFAMSGMAVLVVLGATGILAERYADLL